MMKKMISILLAGFLVWGCSDDPSLDPDEVIRQIRENMEANAFVLDNAFGQTVVKTDGYSHTLLQGGYGRGTFIEQMLDTTARVFTHVINDAQNTQPWQFGHTFTITLDHVTYPFKEYLDLIPEGLEGRNPGSGVIDLFSQDLDTKLNKDPNKTIKLIESTRNSSSTDGLPHETISLSYAKIKTIKNHIESLIMTTDDPEVLKIELEEALITGNQTTSSPILASGLMLISTRIRHTLGASANTYQGFTSSTLGTMNAKQQIDWDKKMRRAALLFVIESLTQENFKPSDEDYLSLYLMQAMHKSTLVLTWAQQHSNH